MMSSRVELRKSTKFKWPKETMKKLSKLRDLKVGVLKGTGVHPNSDGATVAQVAWWNEFGTDDIPSRPFLRTTMRENRRKFSKVTKTIYERALKGVGNVENMVDALGMLAQSLVVQAIDNTLTPPNAPATLEAKAPKTHPLINTGRLRQSISYAEDK